MRRIFILALSLFGLFDSLYLLWAYTSSSQPMVCAGGGCDVVRASSYAHFAGIPTPAYGVAMYAVLAVLSFADPLLAAGTARMAQGLLACMAAAGFLISAYLTGIEGLVIHSWCVWCVGSAITITLILLLAVYEAVHAAPPRDPARRLAGMQRNLGILLAGIVLGIPSFVLLMRRERMPPSPPPPAGALVARLVRPDSHFYGNSDAKLTVVEFGDFECPYCGEEEKTAREIREKYSDKVRFAFRQYPLTAIHPYAEKAAEASECAAQQGKFWKAVDFLYAHQLDLTASALHRYAPDLGLNQEEYDRCLDSGAMADRVQQDKKDGQALNVNSVPTFFIGHDMSKGAIDFRKFSGLIESQLAIATAANPQPPAPMTEKKAGMTEAARSMPAPEAPGGPAITPASKPILGQSGSNVFANLGGSTTGCSEAEAKLKQPTLIGTPAAKNLFDRRQQTKFVDVRSPKEFEAGHIAGALDMPIDRFEQKSVSLPRNETIVLYESGLASGDVCAASRAAGRILLSQGFPSSQVKVYQEGLAGWEKAGLPVVR